MNSLLKKIAKDNDISEYMLNSIYSSMFKEMKTMMSNKEPKAINITHFGKIYPNIGYINKKISLLIKNSREKGTGEYNEQIKALWKFRREIMDV